LRSSVGEVTMQHVKPATAPAVEYSGAQSLESSQRAKRSKNKHTASEDLGQREGPSLITLQESFCGRVGPKQDSVQCSDSEHWRNDTTIITRKPFGFQHFYRTIDHSGVHCARLKSNLQSSKRILSQSIRLKLMREKATTFGQARTEQCSRLFQRSTNLDNIKRLANENSR
jgi:hypothetical protein